MDREKKERGHTESLQDQRMPKPADGQKRQNRKEDEKLQERQAEEAVQQELGEQIQSILQEESGEPETSSQKPSSQEPSKQEPALRTEEGSRRRRRASRQKKGWKRLCKRFLLLFLLILFVTAAGCGFLGWKFYSNCRAEVEGLVAESTEADFLPGQASYFYDAAGKIGRAHV